MFNWFKNKIELKNSNSIMSSVYEKSGVKIGTELTVPQNYECLIYHNSKHYLSLPAGKYNVDKVSFLPLFEKQQKGSKKLKRLKFISHYVNLSPQKIELSIKKTKYAISFEITNSILFAEYILLYAYKTDNNYTYYCLKDAFEECIKTFKTDIPTNANKYLTKLGIKIINCNNASHKSIFDNSPQLDDNNISQITQNSSINQNYNETLNVPTQSTNTHLSYNEKYNIPAQNSQNYNSQPNYIDNNTQPSQNSSKNIQSVKTFPTCPKCNTVLKLDTEYCLNCGHKLK